MLKEDSNATVVIGMLNRSLPIIDNSENLRLLFFHHSNTSMCSKNRKPRFGSPNMSQVDYFQIYYLIHFHTLLIPIN